MVGNSNQRRGGGVRWRGAGYPRAAVVMTPLRNATPPALRHVFSHCVIFATPLRCIIPLGAGGAVMGWIAIASIIGRGIAIALAGAGAFVVANYALDWL